MELGPLPHLQKRKKTLSLCLYIYSAMSWSRECYSQYYSNSKGKFSKLLPKIFSTFPVTKLCNENCGVQSV